MPIPEGFSLTTGIVGLVSFTYTLSKSMYNNIEALSNTPKHLREASEDVKFIYFALGTLQGYLEEDMTSPAVLHPMTSVDLNSALTNCMETCQTLNAVIVQYKIDIKTHTIGLWGRIEAVWSASQIETLQKRLSNHKISLCVALATANHINNASNTKLSSRIESEVIKVKQSVVSLYQRLDQVLDDYRDNIVIISNYKDTIRGYLCSGDSISSSTATQKASTASFRVSSYEPSQEGKSYYTAPSYLTAPSYYTAPSINPSSPQALTSDESFAQPSGDPMLCLPAIRQVSVRGLTPRSITVRFETFFDQPPTGGILRECISHISGVPVRFLCLTYNGTLLDDEAPLEKFGITNGSTVFAIVRDCVAINTTTLASGIPPMFRLPIVPTTTVRDLCREIQEITSLPEESQILKFAGKALDPEKTVGEYNVVFGATLDLHLRRKATKEQYKSLTKLEDSGSHFNNQSGVEARAGVGSHSIAIISEHPSVDCETLVQYSEIEDEKEDGF
ncbi:MAG: hypothetical protein M1821_004796 [Bathelium mastoideum]|nr:MAG: hypothetical protein M1821_004796 [Bathelium mastoideum]